MRALIWALGFFLALFPAKGAAPVVIPPMPKHEPSFVGAEADDELEWFMYELEAQRDYVAEFTALFNSYETKWSKNGRLMIRRPGDKSFRFAKKG